MTTTPTRPLRVAGAAAAAFLVAGLSLPIAPTAAAAPSPAASAGPADVTHAQLQQMFGKRVATHSRVAANLPRLNREMRQAGITTPERQAAFLATLVNESRLDPAANEVGVRSRYKGRGYIQLTGAWNYGAAGKAIGVNLKGNPAAAAKPQHSAAIATWYWTKARPKTNAAADNFDMGRVSRYVGYAASSREDRERCNDFKRAYTVLSGGKQVPVKTRCYRH
ncbi:glycoside hydrolase family 19 protein [Luteococcus sp. Sow4_B9]|uniref:glycoside hydrolase family 19 protein n=1 Tax=Luteococcus sp. Sow4_B9 TaxID=3438792 RepID=UPI003F9E7E96